MCACLPSAGPPALGDKPPHSPGCLSGPRASSPTFPPGCATSESQTFGNMSSVSLKISVITIHSVSDTAKRLTFEMTTDITSSVYSIFFQNHKKKKSDLSMLV